MAHDLENEVLGHFLQLLVEFREEQSPAENTSWEGQMNEKSKFCESSCLSETHDGGIFLPILRCAYASPSPTPIRYTGEDIQPCSPLTL